MLMEKLKIVSHRSAEEFLHNDLYGLDHEEVWIIYLNNSNVVIDKGMVSRGTLSQTSIDCRTVLRQALLRDAAAIFLLHNHPYGESTPSPEDIRFTSELNNACNLIGIYLYDHVIVGEDNFYSFNMEKSYKY